MCCFSVLAGVAGYQAISGAASCDCFGLLEVNPWATLVFDTGGVLAMLYFSSSSRSASGSEGSGPRRRLFGDLPVGQMLLLGLGLIFAVFGGTFAVFGSPASALAWLSGSRVTIQPEVVDLGSARPGEERQISFEVSNSGDAPVTIVGGTST